MHAHREALCALQNAVPDHDRDDVPRLASDAKDEMARIITGGARGCLYRQPVWVNVMGDSGFTFNGGKDDPSMNVESRDFLGLVFSIRDRI